MPAKPAMPPEPFARWVSAPTAKEMAFLACGAAGTETRRAKRRCYIIRISGFVILLTALACTGCFSPRPDLYRLRGRVLDAETGRGLGDARLRLRATIATDLGPKVFSAYGMTGPDGAYEMELGAGYDALRLAGRIRLDVGKSGYATGGAEIPPPARKQKVYAAPDVVLQRAESKPFAPPRAGKAPG